MEMSKISPAMVETSVDYLNRLLDENNVKCNSAAKRSAIISIIQLLDENKLNGLLESIREDYDKARKLIKYGESKQETIDRMCVATNKLTAEIATKRQELHRLEKKGMQAIEEAKDKEILPGERSRLRAYEKAISIGEDALGNFSTSSQRMQVIRSAGIVAAGFTGSLTAKQEGQKDSGN